MSELGQQPWGQGVEEGGLEPSGFSHVGLWEWRSRVVKVLADLALQENWFLLQSERGSVLFQLRF